MFGRKSRRRLLRENDAMRQALCWYAAKETWRRKGIHPRGAARKQWQKSPAAYDRGRLAIQVLTQLDDPTAPVAMVFNVSMPLADANLKPTRLEDMPHPVLMTADQEAALRADPAWQQKAPAIPATDKD